MPTLRVLSFAVAISLAIPFHTVDAATCTALTAQRLTKNPTQTGKRIVFVYVVPSGAADHRLDVPTACSDGKFTPSTFAYAYRDMSIWMAKRLAPTSVGSRRLAIATRTFTHPYTRRLHSAPAVIFVRSGTAVSTWDCWDPIRKLKEVRALLMARGLTSTNYIYAAILQAKQTCTARGTAGVGWLDASGTAYGYAYTLRYFYAGSGKYLPARYGCANYMGDGVLAHEIFHVLGGVPFTAQGGDAAGHSTTDHDVLESVIDSPFASSTGATRLHLDPGSDDYRTEIFGKDWDIAGYSPSTAYRLC